MSNKMLIDASHPEETRVAVVRGNRIEEFDFESQEKKQLRGNIYLAKVTRVEPSLQAAFIDYGGNRHGFLAFSEIHPDYYQIPVADRQALLEAEAAEARAMREAEEAEDDDIEGDQETIDAEVEAAEAEEKPKPKRRRRTSKSKSAAEKTDDAADTTSTSDTPSEAEEIQAGEAKEADSEVDEKPKPKRRTTRRKKVKEETEAEEVSAADEVTAENSEAEPSNGETSDDDSNPPTTIAAIVEIDEISEPLPEDEDKEPSDEVEAETVEEKAEPEEEKPKRKRTTRARKKKTDTAKEGDKEIEAAVVEANEEEAKSDGESEETEQVNEEAEEDKPKRRASRRSSGRKRKSANAKNEEKPSDDVASNDGDDDEGDNAESIESVGQDDALEEVTPRRRNFRQYKIQEVIKRRQVLLIQVVKEERGNKGAALTTYLSLAGRYSVLMPNTARGGGISRKITNSADRKRLKTIASELEVPEGMGVILRTAGAARTKDEIERDFQYLMRLWEQVRNLTLASTAPCLVYEEGSLIKRSIRDLYNKDTDEIIVSGEEGHKEAHAFMEMLMPEHADRVKQYNGSQAIFAKYGVENHLENMVSPQVTLKSGGYLVINQTEALVAVDVNSGRATREHSVEKTALHTNLEAAEEVARQLRLRDLAGLIVIDFIDMEERRNNRAVEKKLKDCLKNDRARIQVGRISHFGLMEMSRQRIRASVLESTMEVCPHCGGVGYVRSDSAIALHVFRALEEHISRNRNRDATLKTTPAIAVHLLNNKRAALVDLEARYGIQITVLGDHHITGQDFKIEKGDKARDGGQPNAIGYEGENSGDTANQEESDNKRKRSRRRRKKNTGDEIAEASEEAQTSSSEVDDEGDDDDDDKPRRKRRRGKRGGSRRSDVENNNEEVVDASPTDTTGEEGAVSASSVEGETAKAVPIEAEVEAETEEAKPRTRSTRRKKAPIAKKTDENTASADTAVVETASEETAAPPPKPRRRTTRRKKAEDEQTVAEIATEASHEDSISEEVTGSGGDEADTGDEKPKKKSWWSRGEGFF